MSSIRPLQRSHSLQMISALKFIRLVLFVCLFVLVWCGVWVGMNSSSCVHECGSQRSMASAILQELIILLMETGTFIDLEYPQ